jgi:outer membrane protein assembly factor BamE
MLAVGLPLIVGCDREHERLMREKYPSYPPMIKHAIDRGYPMGGMDHDQVRLALGEPVCKKTIEFDGRPVEVWLFPPGGRDPCVTPNFRVYFENGLVTGWKDLRAEPLHGVPPVVKRGDPPGGSVE